MQLATIKCDFWHPNETSLGYILSSVQDVIDYNEVISKKMADDWMHLVKNDIPINKWDHSSNPFINMGYNVASISGGTPIIEACKLIEVKTNNLMRIIEDFGQVFINSKGGFMPVRDGVHVIESKEMTFTLPKELHIASQPCWINLENDSELENHTKRWFSENNHTLSYITHMRNYSKDDLVDAFKKFKRDGGSSVYVYTTGTDISQMYEYCEAMITAGLNTLRLEFNVGQIDGHVEFFEYVKELNIHFSFQYL